ncbi:MAG: pirin family protein [Acidobacteria bacterium]|nr:pirin family protein [Acidobacteriota bacterium]
MITLRPANERGQMKLDWLDSRHTFSFDRYYDPQHMGFRHLRVINEDRVEPSRGFPPHSHRDMEIITYILQGSLEHEDSLGHRSVIRRGEVQRMSAGTGITHSEYNPSQTEPVHLLQIWIRPERLGLPPSYEQREFPIEESTGTLILVAAPDGLANAITVHQNVRLLVGRLRGGENLTYRLQPDRHAWVQVAQGTAELNSVPLQSGDGVAISQEDSLLFSAAPGSQTTEILLFDLA